MQYEVKREAHVHGKQWGKIAGGYFADKRIAEKYVAAIMRVAGRLKPSVIVDLGGGTGFILEQLVEAGIGEDVRLINMDESESQLAMCRHPRITPLKCDLQSFSRVDLVDEAGRLMLICRSVLQYTGILGQKPSLAHLRAQMKTGEWFIHQSGCSDDVEAALALDVLFEMMGVDKWVPHKEAFVRLMVQAGFEITEDFPLPAVDMISEEMAFRYGVSPETLSKIEADLRRTCANRPDMFRTTPGGFVFSFPYRVFVCKAV
jgi:hypothetical protein